MEKREIQINGKSYLYTSHDNNPYWKGYGPERELDITEFIKRFIPKDAVCFDVGANIGLISLILSNHFNGDGDGKIYAFEPGSKNVESLYENIRLNDIKNIYPFQCAISDKVKLVSFTKTTHGVL